MTATEVAQLEVADVLAEDGEYRTASEVRAAIAFNARRRPIYWTNARVREALDAYLAERVRLQQGVTAWRSQWRGLVQLGPVFLTNDGRPFTLTTRKTGAGNARPSSSAVVDCSMLLHPSCRLTNLRTTVIAINGPLGRRCGTARNANAGG
jgi:hypothetical protein